MKSLFIYPLLTVLLSSACGSSKESSSSKPTPPQAPATTTNTSPVTPQAADMSTQDTEKQAHNYRLIISFISIGEGTDPKAREMMDRVLNNWKEKTGAAVAMESVPWGREGEVDFCFNLNELPDNQQVDFVNDMKTTFEGKKLIQITENQPCMHKR